MTSDRPEGPDTPSAEERTADASDAPGIGTATPRLRGEPQEEPRAPDDLFDDGLDLDAEAEDHSDALGQSPAATALWILLGVLAVAATTLWLAPKLAPLVPAPVADLIAPRPEGLENRIAALEARVAAAEAKSADTQAQLAAAEEALGMARAEIAAGPSTGDLDGILTRMERIEVAQAAVVGMAEAARGAARAALAEAEAAQRSAGDASAAAETARLSAEQAGETARLAEETASAAASVAETARISAEESARAANTAHREARTVRESGAALTARFDALAAENLAQGSRLEALAASLSGVGLRDPDASPTAEPADAPVGGGAVEIGALQARLDQLAGELAQTRARQLPAAADLATRAALEETAEAMAGRLDALGAELSDLAIGLAELQTLLARETDTLQRRLGGDIAAAKTRLDRLSDRLSVAEAGIAANRASALSEAEAVLRDARLRSSADALATRVLAGKPYAGMLGEVEALMVTSAPTDLAAPAHRGLVSVADLTERLPEAARSAIRADAQADAAGTPTGRVSSWLQSQIFVMPTEEQPGNGLAARLSRIEARLIEGELAEALSEVEALPGASRRAMADWTEDLRIRVAAEAALARFLAPVLMEQ